MANSASKATTTKSDTKTTKPKAAKRHFRADAGALAVVIQPGTSSVMTYVEFKAAGTSKRVKGVITAHATAAEAQAAAEQMVQDTLAKGWTPVVGSNGPRQIFSEIPSASASAPAAEPPAAEPAKDEKKGRRAAA